MTLRVSQTAIRLVRRQIIQAIFYFLDDRVKDSNFQIESTASDSNSDENLPKAGLSCKSIKRLCLYPSVQSPSVKVQSDNIDAQLSNIDSQPPRTDIDTHTPIVDGNSQLLNVDLKPASIDSQPLDTQWFSKTKANPMSWKKNVAKELKNSGKSYTSLVESKRVIPYRKMSPEMFR